MEKSLNVFVALTGSKIIGPFFFDNDDGSTATIHGQRYSEMLENYVISFMKRHRMIKKTTFQQDGAPPHVCNMVKKILTNNFGERVISKGFTNEWPANSPA